MYWKSPTLPLLTAWIIEHNQLIRMEGTYCMTQRYSLEMYCCLERLVYLYFGYLQTYFGCRSKCRWPSLSPSSFTADALESQVGSGGCWLLGSSPTYSFPFFLSFSVTPSWLLHPSLSLPVLSKLSSFFFFFSLARGPKTPVTCSHLPLHIDVLRDGTHPDLLIFIDQ